MEKEMIVAMSGALTLTLFLILLFFILPSFNDGCCMCGSISNGCCPCQNSTAIQLVEGHYGFHASSAGSWDMMCENYKEEMNQTFECFT